MNSCALLTKLLLIGAIAPPRVDGHSFWVETNVEADSVSVIFSEYAGVPSKVIAKKSSYLTKIGYTGVDKKFDVPLSLNDEETALEGDLTPPTLGAHQNDGPAYVSEFFDNGPYERFADVRFSFGAQIYKSEADYEGFFRPLLNESEDTPLIVMRNCGGDNGTSYQFDVAGFSSEEPVGVCIYQKGGLLMGCGSFGSEALERYVPKEISRGRKLRSGGGESQNRGPKMGLSVEASPVISQVLHQEAPNLLYARANQTLTDEVSGDIVITVATTSVYFEGPCKK